MSAEGRIEKDGAGRVSLQPKRALSKGMENSPPKKRHVDMAVPDPVAMPEQASEKSADKSIDKEADESMDEKANEPMVEEANKASGASDEMDDTESVVALLLCVLRAFENLRE